MDIVIDASVIIAVIADEPEKAAIVAQTRGANLVAPRSIHWEIGNAFSAMLKRRKIALDQALKAVAVYRTIPIRFVDIELETALEIAAQLDIYAYDAYLIQCALKYQLPLITLDQELINCAIQKGIKVIRVIG